MGDGGAYDHDKLKAAADKLEKASKSIVEVGRGLPDQVNAGPYTEQCAATLKVLLEASTELAVRLQVASDGARTTEWTVSAIEQANEDDAEDIDTEGGGG